MARTRLSPTRRPGLPRALRLTICIAALLLSSATFCASAGAAPPPAGDSSPVDPITGVVHSRRLASGVPLGGIGAGTFQVMTDGAISAATYNNNWAYPSGDLPGCFLAVRAAAAGRPVGRVLALKNAYGLPAISGVDYSGLFPVAKLAYQDLALPVQVSVRAFSPLIPHDLRNSSFPAAAFIVRLTNLSGGEAQASVALSWENTLGAGGAATTGRFDSRAGNTVAAVPDA
ncbi:MAG TPA: GH116 family glycosyl-hydrolase, partial [Chthonomonadaceae bacterium]|nr:GH116 family glycosyl-hydrolase [Chthonomonadaceae bacterium]